MNDTHECSSYQEGEYVIFTCSICGYEIRYNRATGYLEKINGGDGSSHHGSAMPGFSVSNVGIPQKSLAVRLFEKFIPWIKDE